VTAHFLRAVVDSVAQRREGEIQFRANVHGVHCSGVPTNRAFLYAIWRVAGPLRVTPSLELADDRWSDVNPPPAFPYVKTGAYSLLDLDVTYELSRSLQFGAGFKNLLDDDYQLAWGYPQQGRIFYLKTRTIF
jgi:iron complex outermembrane recepter protein